MALMLKNNTVIKGIKVNDSEFLLSQYAEDTTVLLDAPEKSLTATMKVLKFYAEISGLCLNLDETIVVRICSLEKSNKV